MLLQYATILAEIVMATIQNNRQRSDPDLCWPSFFFAAGLMMSGSFQPPLQLHDFPLCEQEFTWLASISLRGKPSLIFNHSISTFAKTYLFECIFWCDICHWNGWYTVSTVPSKHFIAHNAYPGLAQPIAVNRRSTFRLGAPEDSARLLPPASARCYRKTAATPQRVQNGCRLPSTK